MTQDANQTADPGTQAPTVMVHKRKGRPRKITVIQPPPPGKEGLVPIHFDNGQTEYFPPPPTDFDRFAHKTFLDKLDAAYKALLPVPLGERDERWKPPVELTVNRAAKKVCPNFPSNWGDHRPIPVVVDQQAFEDNSVPQFRFVEAEK